MFSNLLALLVILKRIEVHNQALEYFRISLLQLIYPVNLRYNYWWLRVTWYEQNTKIYHVAELPPEYQIYPTKIIVFLSHF